MKRIDGQRYSNCRLWILCISMVMVMIIAAGCAFDYEQAELARELSESVPTIVVVESQYVFKRTDSRSIIINAKEVSYFSTDEQHFVDVSFFEVDNERNVLNQGFSKFATYHADTNNFELEGDITFDSHEHNAVVEAEHLIWNDQEQQLLGMTDESVRITRASGTIIEGTGLRANLNTRTIELDETSGIIVPGEDDAKSLQKLEETFTVYR